MRLPFGLTLTRQKAVVAVEKAAAPVGSSAITGGGAWTRLWSHDFRDFLGSWQQDIEIKHDAVLAQATVFTCITLIASDIAKLNLRVVQRYGRVWLEKTTEGLSELLETPNHFQTRQQFIENWLISKLSHGNTYVLKDRPSRGARPRKLYVLDPERCIPLVAPDGSVYYQLGDDDLAGVAEPMHVVPASEIIHDRFNCLFHPLVGLSPIFASGLAAMQALQIQQNSAKFFKNQSRPSGILTAPKQISDETAKRIKDYWEANYQGENKIGSVAVLGDSLSYTPMTMNAVDAQLVEQLKITAEQVCATFHVPPYMAAAAPPPALNNIEAEQQRYYNQCLQALIEGAEACLDAGLDLNKPVDGETLRTNFDLRDLLRMDKAAQVKTLTEAVKGGVMKPDEARGDLDLLPVKGGDAVYLQQQNFSLEALAKRDAAEDPFGKTPAPAPSAPQPPEPDAAKIAGDALRIVKEAETQDRAARAEQQAAESAQTAAAAEARAQQAEIERAAAMAQREAERLAAEVAATLAREQEVARLAEVERAHAARLAEQEAAIRREAEAASAAAAAEAQRRADTAAADAQREAAEAISAAQREAVAAIERARADTAAGMAQMVAAVDQRMQQMLDEAKAAREADAASRAAEVEAARSAQAEATARREAEAVAHTEIEERSAKAFADLLIAEFTDA